MSEVPLGKTEEEAIEAFDVWRRKIKAGNPHCPECHGQRGWSGIRMNWSSAHELTGYSLLVCCGQESESDTAKIMRRLDDIQKELERILGHIAQQSFLIRGAESSLSIGIEARYTLLNAHIERLTLRYKMRRLWQTARAFLGRMRQ